MSSKYPDHSNDPESEDRSGFSKRIVDASKLAVGIMAIKAADELTKLVVKRPQRPEEESRREFTVKEKPTRTFARAARAVQYWQTNPDKFNKRPQSYDSKTAETKENWFNRKKKDFIGTNVSEANIKSAGSTSPPITPGLDGIFSFIILLAPVAFVLGIINYYVHISDLLIIWILAIYIIFIAIPGSYLGLDAMRAGTIMLLRESQSTIKIGIKSIWMAIKLFFQAIIELIIITVNFIINNIQDYWVLVLTYLVSIGILFFIIQAILANTTLSLLTLFMLVVIPAMFPAVIFHRWWILYRFNKNYSYHY